MCLGRCVVRGLPSVVRGRTLSEPPNRVAPDKPASHQQVLNVRSHLVAADAFLAWLEDRGKTLSGCTQAEVESYLNTKPVHAKRCSAFVRWAAQRRYVPAGIKATATRWTGPAGPHDQDERWEVARRLLNDPSIPTEDRVAGLLVLLYAQTASSIHRLTTDRVTRDEDHVLIHLGDRPIRLPAPLDKLMLELVASRATDTLIRHDGTGSSRDGRQDGQSTSRSCSDGSALTESGPRQGRSTALFTLARQLPAGQLSKMLGIHVGVAVAWQRASGGDWVGYAADVAARSAIRTRSQASDDTDQSAELHLFDESRLSACEAATWWHRNAADMCRRARCRSELQRAKPPAFQRRNPGHLPVPPTPQAIHVDTGDLGERPQLRHELLAVDECLSTAAAVGVIGGRAARRAGHGWGRHG